MELKKLPAILAASGMVFALQGHAITSTDNLMVTAEVAANCTITTLPVAFGAYDPIGTNASSPLNATGTVTVRCTNGSPSTITLGQGVNPDTGSTDDIPLRRMAGGPSRLSYGLYSDAGFTTVWGNTLWTGVPHTGDGTATAITVYGEVPAGQNVTATNYSDMVVATVTF